MLFDISYEIDDELLIFPGDPKFSIERKIYYEDSGCNVSSISIGTHTGTHIDAPLHFVDGGNDIASMPVDRFFGNAEVIDLSKDDEIKIIDDITLEKKIKTCNDIILIKTTNGARFNGKNILNDFVSLSLSGAEWLVNHNIKIVGIDYMTIEKVEKNKKSAHNILLDAGIMIAESLKLQGVKEGEYRFYGFPLKIKNADGCPIRAILEG